MLLTLEISHCSGFPGKAITGNLSGWEGKLGERVGAQGWKAKPSTVLILAPETKYHLGITGVETGAGILAAGFGARKVLE